MSTLKSIEVNKCSSFGFEFNSKPPTVIDIIRLETKSCRILPLNHVKKYDLT